MMPPADFPSLQSIAVQGQLWEQWWPWGGVSFGFHFTGTRVAQAVAQITAKSKGFVIRTDSGQPPDLSGVTQALVNSYKFRHLYEAFLSLICFLKLANGNKCLDKP